MVVEVAFFVHIFSTGIGCVYGLVSVHFAFYQFVISLLVSLIICRRGESQLFHVTRSTWNKYQLHFVELCVHVHLLCASLSLLGKYQANNFLSDVAVLFQLRTPSTFHILDLVATLSILAIHLTGHHDVINRIRRRLGWLGRGVQRYVRWLFEVSLKILDEVPSDLEDQSDQSPQPHKMSAKTTRPLPSPTTTHSNNDFLESHNQGLVETTGNHIHNQLDGESPARFQQMRRVSSDFVHKEIRSFEAQVRWSTARYAFRIQNRPFPDASFLVTVLGQALPMFASDNLGDLEHGLRFPHGGDIAHRSSSSITSAVMDMVHRKPYPGIAQVPRQGFDGTQESTVNSDPPPSMQLPGTIQNTSVKALPDTGSSQNVVDSEFVQTLDPAVTVEPIDSQDKPLRAPDGVIIPCTGKVSLPWAFKDEPKPYQLWFYVVENCLHDVIIGNGFLRVTETFEEHQERLEINIRPDLERHPGNLVSGAQEVSWRRQILSGTINGQNIDASLDTGCEVNLMSAEYVKGLGFDPMSLPGGKQKIKFTNGRKGSTLGQVEVNWSFNDDSPDVVKIKCYVLPRCIHSVIFGVQFAVSEKPWEKHRSTLSWKELPDAGDAGVVGLSETRRYLLGKKNIGGFSNSHASDFARLF